MIFLKLQKIYNNSSFGLYHTLQLIDNSCSTQDNWLFWEVLLESICHVWYLKVNPQTGQLWEWTLQLSMQSGMQQHGHSPKSARSKHQIHASVFARFSTLVTTRWKQFGQTTLIGLGPEGTGIDLAILTGLLGAEGGNKSGDLELSSSFRGLVGIFVGIFCKVFVLLSLNSFACGWFPGSLVFGFVMPFDMVESAVKYLLVSADCVGVLYALTLSKGDSVATEDDRRSWPSFSALF